MPSRLIQQKDLAPIVGVSNNVLQVYLSHYTLFKFVTYKHRRVEGKRVRSKYFILTKESINALENYLEIKKFTNKHLNPKAIEQIKKIYEKMGVNKPNGENNDRF